MNFSKEQIDFIKNASDHVNVLCGGRGYGKTHQLIKEMEDKINKLEKENQQLKKQKDDVVEFIHKELDRFDCEGSMSISMRISYFKEDLLRMLGEEE